MEQSKKSFLKNVVGFSMTTWISFLLGFVATTITTRLFSTAEYGKLSLFSTYVALFSATCYLGLDQAYVRFFREPPGKSDRRGMLTFCTVTSMGFALLSALLLAFAWRGVSSLAMKQPDAGVYVCMAVYGFCQIQFRYLSLSYRMEQNAKLYTIQGVLQVVITKFAYLATAFQDATAKPAIILLTVLMAVFTLIFTWVQRRQFNPRFYRQVDRPFVKTMSSFAAPLIPLAVMSWLNSAISLVMLDTLMSPAAVGIYTSALTLASTVNVIQSGFNTYWAPYVYEHYLKDDKGRFFTVHRLMACLLTGFGLTMTLFQVPVYLLLGHNFRSSAIYFPFLFLAPICYCLGETTGMGIGISKKSYWNTLIFLASSVTTLGLSLWLIPLLQDAGAAIAAAAGAILSLGLRTAIGEKYYRAITQYRYLGYTLGLMLAASLANYLLRDQTLVKYALLLAVYGLALYLFRREIASLWRTARQVLREGAGVLKRKAAQTADGGK